MEPTTLTRFTIAALHLEQALCYPGIGYEWVKNRFGNAQALDAFFEQEEVDKS